MENYVMGNLYNSSHGKREKGKLRSGWLKRALVHFKVGDAKKNFFSCLEGPYVYSKVEKE